MPLAPAVCEEGSDPSPDIERRFFAKLRLPNGTWKTTYPNRLDDVNRKLLEFLPADRDLDLMDVAISSGISTLEWSDQLLANGIGHRIVAGDIDPGGRLVTWGEWFAALFDSSGREPLLLEVGPLTLPMRSGRRLARFARPLLTPILRALSGRARPVSLVSVELRRRPEVEVVRDDVTTSGRFAESFDVIRAANLLQPTYFDERTLRTIVDNLRGRLRDGGLLVICRTGGDGLNRATIFRHSDKRFSPLASLNGGAEIEDLILST